VIRVVLPYHLRVLAHVDGEVRLDVADPVTIESVVDALEEQHPVLRGRIRDAVSRQRRAFVRYYACEADLSHEPAGTLVPQPVAEGREPFLVIGAMAGG
jgi:hypothetical protein